MAAINEETLLASIKVDIGLTDELQDGLLKVLLGKVVSHFKLEYDVTEVDEVFDFVLEDCVIKRYNRRGAEGAKSESVEGHSVTYYDPDDEFASYDDLIRKRLNLLENKERKGRVVIL